MKFFGVFACPLGIAADGIGGNIEESSCFSHSASFVDVFDEGDDFIFGQSSVEKDGSTPFGESFVAGAAPQQSGVVGTVGAANADIFGSANAELGAMFIGTTKLIEVVREGLDGLHVP